jgi:hypothetical protein
MSYRKLPGQLRGIFRGASTWLGADHLLAVRSLRFREEYKRFYLRDVQAIAVARKPRFHLSTRAIGIALLWLCASLYFRAGMDAYAIPLAGIGLVAAWIYVSASCSCVCRIYTAVSREELPSVYRTWTARKFLAEVESRIAEVQGPIDANWSGLVETPGEAPATLTPAPQEAARVMSPAPAAAAPMAALQWFSAILFADAMLRLVSFAANSRALAWTLWAMTLARAGMAISMLIRRQHAKLQKLAIVILIASAGLFYFQQVAMSVGAAMRAQRSIPFGLGNEASLLLYRIDIGANVILDIAGLLIIARAKRKS